MGNCWGNVMACWTAAMMVTQTEPPRASTLEYRLFEAASQSKSSKRQMKRLLDSHPPNEATLQSATLSGEEWREEQASAWARRTAGK